MMRSDLGLIRGTTSSVRARVLCNLGTYALIRAVSPAPREGWLHSPKHWYRFPFSLREKILWSPSLAAWFSPADESAIECMLHMSNYEPTQWVAPQPGQVFLDIGGYIGWYTIHAARAVGPAGRVVALEPDGTNRAQLKTNLRLNEIKNCLVLPVAAWSKSGRIGWRSGAEPVWHRAEESAGLPTIEADSVDAIVQRLGLERVDWIKMDIEGGESEALKGAEETLSRFHPVIFTEIHETFDAVEQFLASRGYVCEQMAFDYPPRKHGWTLHRWRQGA